MKNNYVFGLFIILFCVSYVTFCYLKEVDNVDLIDGGVVKDHILKGYSEDIKSREIVSFEYIGGEFSASCKLDGDTLHVKSRGGDSSNRDGSFFILDYEAKNNDILEKLQDVVSKYDISKNNGYEHETAGLPPGLGDSISVLYKSGEKIWKYSNQFPTISSEAAKAIYELFHECAKENSYDFTSAGSNVLLYDDATEDYLQGTWKGKHFGKEYKVIFSKDNVKIYEDNILTDDVNYIIIDGNIVVNKPKDEAHTPKDRYDYEEFNVISTMSKKNDFTIVAYFLKDGYSTCDLLKQK